MTAFTDQFGRKLPKLRPWVEPVAVQVADVSDAAEFPEIARARRWLDSLSPERRAELEKEAE